VFPTPSSLNSLGSNFGRRAESSVVKSAIRTLNALYVRDPGAEYSGGISGSLGQRGSQCGFEGSALVTVFLSSHGQAHLIDAFERSSTGRAHSRNHSD
jgi:hypothetical protein